MSHQPLGRTKIIDFIRVQAGSACERVADMAADECSNGAYGLFYEKPKMKRYR
ncbi:MAG: hypothetical protein ACI9KN_002303 [Gammaproteobacteria bacterium]|jgi:hypothetical protein